jgi:peptide-methionine (S)-S-oxide reductase
VLFSSHKNRMPEPADALPGRDDYPFMIPARHEVLDAPLQGPFAPNLQIAYFGTGCFWGAERVFWKIPGVYTTAVGYQGGMTPFPTYEETCSGKTGHTEVVMVVFDPAKVTFGELLKVFWENHDPTQGYRQGNDVGTQYRSSIYFTNESQEHDALATRDAYQKVLTSKGLDEITTEIAQAGPFYYAEPYHQQYLAPTKNPHGYDCHSSTGVELPSLESIGLAAAK